MENTVKTRLSGGGQGNLSSLTGIGTGIKPFRAAERRTIKRGFTLAEVLITLGIIGVVASMSLPSLVQKQTEKTTVARVKKAYSILQQAYMLTVQDNGMPDEWGATGMYEKDSHVFVANKFIPYMKVTTNCVNKGADYAKKNCVGEEFALETTYASVKVADGVTIIFRTYDGTCSHKYGNNKYLQNICGTISIDTNSTGKPNISGQDIFGFYLTKYGIYPRGTALDEVNTMEEFCTNTRTWGKNYGSFTNGVACSAWVLYNENMDYLHCNLNWKSGKKSCKK